MVEGEGFEPSKLARQIYSLIPLTTREPLHKRGAIVIYSPNPVKPIIKINQLTVFIEVYFLSWH